MSSRKSHILFSILAGVIICACFFLPEAAGIIHEKKNEDNIENYKVAQIKYGVSTSEVVYIADQLELMSGDYYIRNWNDNTDDDVKFQKYAENALEYLYANGLTYCTTETLVEKSGEPVQIINEDESVVSLGWIYRFSSIDSNYSVTLILDYETGKILAFTASDNSNDAVPMDDETYYQQEESWAESLMEYYGFDSYDISKSAYSEATFNFMITFTIDKGVKLNIPLKIVIQPSLYEFNMK